jgi:hypothetical protein
MSKKTIVKVILKNLVFQEKSLIGHKRLLLNTVQILEQVTPKSESRKSSPCSIFGDTFTINTLQFLKHIKDSQI